MIYFTTNQEIYDYHARKVINDHLRNNPGTKMKYSYEHTIKELQSGWDTDIKRCIITEHRRKYRINTK